MDLIFRQAYDSSPMRCNFISWFDFGPDSQMLVLGDVGEVVLSFLRQRVKSVEVDATEGVLYDYILLFDSCMDSRFDVLEPNILRALSRKLKPQGKFFLAMENVMGLKFLAGAADGRTQKAYARLEGFDKETRVKGYTKKEVENSLQKAGFRNLYFYYPTPDHIFSEAVYSENFLPAKGDLRGNAPSYSYGGYSTFSENMVFDRLIEKGEFENFANSFLVVAE